MSLLVSQNDLETEEGRSREREKRILWSAATAALAKVISTAIPLITVKITLSYLGDELYGLWATIISFFSLFAFADLGLGNGLQTELSRASGKQNNSEKCRKIVSSAYLMISVVAMLLIMVFVVVFPLVDWSGLMSAESSTAKAMTSTFVMAIFLSKLVGIPVSLVQRTQNALQEGYISNIWSSLGSVLSLIVVVVFASLDLGRAQMMWFSSFAVVITSLLNSLFFYVIKRPDLKPSIRFIDFKITKLLLSTGILFFILSIITSVSLSLDNFIVAKVTSLSETTPYSIAYKVASFIGIISTMLSTPLWAANGEALARGEYSWVKKQTVKMTNVSFVLSFLASVFLVVLSKPVLGWLGSGTQVSYSILIGMCFQQILIATANPAFMVLNASRKIKIQMLMYGIYSVLSISLKYVLGQMYGAIAIAWVGPICYLAIICPFVAWSARNVLGGKK